MLSIFTTKMNRNLLLHIQSPKDQLAFFPTQVFQVNLSIKDLLEVRTSQIITTFKEFTNNAIDIWSPNVEVKTSDLARKTQWAGKNLLHFSLHTALLASCLAHMKYLILTSYIVLKMSIKEMNCSICDISFSKSFESFGTNF